MKTLQLFLVCLCVISTFVACKASPMTTTENSVSYIDAPRFISVEEAKSIVAADIYQTEFNNQYFILGSPNFDPRVREISWGEPVLVKGLPNGEFYKEEFYYYVLSGVMPDGRILAAKTVNAVSGQLLSGQLWVAPEGDVLNFASLSQVQDYAAEKTQMSRAAMKITPVFYYSGAYNSHLILSWKYLVESIDPAPQARGLETGNCVLVDPYVRDYQKSSTLTPENASLYDRGLPHRLFKYNQVPQGFFNRSVRGAEPNIELLPLD